MLPLLLLACPSTPTDTGDDPVADTAADTADTAPNPNDRALATAGVRILGTASSSAGNDLAFGPGTGDGAANSLWVATFFASRVCRIEGLTGTVSVDQGACFSSGATDYMGASISASADGLAAGAIGGNEAGTYAGKVYVLDVDQPAGDWSAADARSTLLGEAAGDYAGIALSWVGDTVGSGRDTLLVGGWSNDEGGIGAGKVYLYASGVPEGTSSLADAPTIIIGTGSASEVKHGAPEAGDGVGSVIRRAGDPNGDGLADFWLGVNGADDGGADAGAAAFFAGPLPEGVVALRDADALIVGSVAGQYVGDYVTGIGDFTGDGVDDVAISGEMDVTGTIWLLHGPFQSGTILEADAAVYGEAEGDQAGASIAAAGDSNADGFHDFVVGAYTHDTSGLDGGAAYLVRGPLTAGSHTLAEASLRWLAEVEGDGAGRHVAGGGDYNGDGVPDVAFGAPYADMGGPFSGTAYVAFGE